jgi:signal transduction histidine kinase
MSVDVESPNGVGDGSHAWLGGTEMAARVLAHDWSASPLGALDDWPPSLRAAFALCLRSRSQMAIYWGPEQICLFNDAESEAGSFHPDALGMPAEQLLANSWRVARPWLRAVMESGEPILREDEPIVGAHADTRNVAYFSHSYSPILDECGAVGGVLLVSHETTAQVVAQRRLALLRDLGAELLETHDAVDVCDVAARNLGGQSDLEFTLVYLTGEDGRRASCAAVSGRSGTPEPVQTEVALDGQRPLDAVFRELAGAAAAPQMLPREHVVRGGSAFASGGRALAVPIRPSVNAPVLGFLVLGCDRPPLADDQLARFAETVAIGIGRSLAASRERERNRSLFAANRVKAELLSNATHELADLLRDLRAAQRRAEVAGDAERQRIERNLHDGAQQRLMAVRLELTLLRETLEADPIAARAELQRLQCELDDALAELRELAHGLYPQLLSTDGLSAAITAAAQRAGFPVLVEIGEFGRLPSVIESAAYFCCVEALQNVAKHAGVGAQATVSLSVQDGTLCFRVSDDGAGFDPAVSGGQGLTNLLDRARALGGQAEIDAAPGQGTTVTGCIPLSVLEDGLSQGDGAYVTAVRG